MIIEGEEISPWHATVKDAANLWKGQHQHVIRAYFAEVLARIITDAGMTPDEKEHFMEDPFTLLEGLIDQRSRLN